jgi:prevent-host-death family protein
MLGKKKEQLINVSQFKAEALRCISEVEALGAEFTITKRGVPVAKVVPVKPFRESGANALRGLMKEHEDIVQFDTSELWEASK